MGLDAFLIAICVFIGAAVLTQWVCRIALARGVIDTPNSRSSHTAPTPKGGGAVIAGLTVVALVILELRGVLAPRLMLAIVGGGLAVAIVGFVDDRTPLSAGIRLPIHFAAALWSLVCLGGMPPLLVGTHLVDLGWYGYLIGTIGIVWVLNLFNFMDGIDGIATSEAIFVCLSGVALVTIAAVPGVAAAGVVFSAACCGFLVWNWPPARIFIAVLALSTARTNPAAVWVWLILGGAFFVDATVTLVLRAVRGEAVHQAHRSHAYQWLARKWRSHLRVTLAVIAINVLWLLPCAAIAATHPAQALWVLVIAWAPLIPAVVLAGAGRRENSAS